MGHYLHTTNRFPLPRHQRFSYQFCDDITTLLRLIIRELLDRQHHTQRNGIDGKIHSTHLNTSLAFFINDCLSLMDRGFVFNLIKIYCKEVRSLSHRIHCHSFSLLVRSGNRSWSTE